MTDKATLPEADVERVIEATQIAMGHGLVDVGPIIFGDRKGIILRPRSSHIPIGEAGELNGEYWPVPGDVVIWIDRPEGADVILSELVPLATLQAEPADFDQGGRAAFEYAASRTEPAVDAVEMVSRDLDFKMLRKAVSGIRDDWMSSSEHHPGYVLIPESKFTEISVADRIMNLRAETDASLPTSGEADTYAAWQQERGMLADKVDWAINEYEQFMLDDAYDSQRVLDLIIGGLRSVRELRDHRSPAGSAEG